MRTDRGKGRRKSQLINASMLVAMLAAVVVFGVMLQVEKNELTRYEKGIIYVAKEEIPEGQMITAENYEWYMECREVDKSCIPDTALAEEQQICDMAAVYDIEKGVLLTLGMFERLEEVLGDMNSPVIAGFKAEDMYQVVGGTLRAGDRIHIYNTEADGTVVRQWQNVYVQQVFDASGAVIPGGDDERVAQRINVYLESTDAEEFYSGLNTGTLRVVKVRR